MGDFSLGAAWLHERLLVGTLSSCPIVPPPLLPIKSPKVLRFASTLVLAKTLIHLQKIKVFCNSGYFKEWISGSDGFSFSLFFFFDGFSQRGISECFQGPAVSLTEACGF